MHRVRPGRDSVVRPRTYEGVLLGWPRDGAPMVVLLQGDAERTLTTSNVRRVLHDGDSLQMFVETRNTVYRVVCATGSEREWRHETGRALAAPPAFDDAGPTDVRDSNEPLRKRRPSRA
jgi:hypothetical protein